MGLLGTIVVIGLFLSLGLVGMRIANRSTRVFWRMAAASVTAWLLIQAVLNVAVAMRMLPVMGVPLPFISYGGSSLIVTMAGMGMLLGIADRSLDPPQGQKKKKEPPEVRRRKMHVVR